MLICGTRALELARQAGLAPKNRGLAGLREQLFAPQTDPPGGHYQVTYDPALTDSEPDKWELIAWDLRLAARFLKTGSLEPEVGSYRWVGGFSELICAINCKYEATGLAVDVSMDSETMGLHPWYPGKDIVSIGFTCEAGKADCLYAGPYDDPVREIRCSARPGARPTSDQRAALDAAARELMLVRRAEDVKVNRLDQRLQERDCGRGGWHDHGLAATTQGCGADLWSL